MRTLLRFANPRWSHSDLTTVIALVTFPHKTVLSLLTVSPAADMAEPIQRVRRTRDEARASYDRLSGWYDWIAAGPSEEACLGLGLRLLGVRPGERALEIGFGTGRGIVRLARAAGPSGKVCGVDVSDGMVEATRRRLEKESSEPSSETQMAPVELHRCDAASDLPFEAESFDAVLMTFTLELFDTPEIPLVLERCKDLLKPGAGRIAVVSLAKDPGSRAGRLYEWLHDRLPAVADCRPIYPQVHLAEAGFEVVEAARASVWGLPVEAVLARKREEGNGLVNPPTGAVSKP
jgi:demethylmenaquinone methyltransferase/2-methoxy-6-polyprenyl-1,4-benzoquinol methylase